MSKNIIIGLLGSTLDSGFGQKRWDRWRPSVSLCQHDDLLIHEYHLLYQPEFQDILNQVVKDIGAVSPETKIVPHAVAFKDAWDFETVYESLFVFCRSFQFRPEENRYLIHITTGTHVAQICLFLLTESRHLPGVLIQSSPSKKSSGTYAIIDLDLSKYDRIAARFQQEVTNDISFLKSGIATKNRAFNTLIERMEYVALRTKDPILLCGPTGAGKSQLARKIYELKKQKQLITGSFVEINCATLRGDAAMSALFGHTKGAFTGAQQARDGLLRAADGGMVFLDEIGELGIDEQTLLLHAIEEKRFLPLGSDTAVQSDFQLICGTNRDLIAGIKAGTFREDLLARIQLWTFTLPGLRDRPEDIEPNIAYEAARFESKNGTRISWNHDAKRMFLEFAISPRAVWQSNFRDLNSSIIRMGTLAPGGRIDRDIVREEINRLSDMWRGSQEISHGISDIPKRVGDIDHFDAIQLTQVIAVCKKHRSLSDAGRALFSVSRNKKRNTNDADRLRKYLARFGLTWDSLQ